MKIRLFTILLIAMTLLLASACQSLLTGSAQNAEEETPVRVTEVTSAQPADVLRDFMVAWDTEDYESMYRLTASASRDLYPRQIFENRYTVAHSVIKFQGVDYTLNDVTQQGTTAILDYNVGIESPTFGVIEDNNRTMRLVQEGGWKIAWSPMDIFDGLSSEARLQVSVRFPQRENIYDRNGQTLAEENGPIVSLYVVQNEMSGVDDCITVLADVTKMQSNTIRAIFTDFVGETRFHIADIDPERYFEHREDLLNVCGIVDTDDALSDVLQYTSRRYFGHGIASHIVGYVGRVPVEQLTSWEARGYTESDIVGLIGVENAYEEELAGRPERFLRIVEPGGTVVRELGGAIGSPPQPVTLTLDRDLQQYVADAMADAVDYALPNWGAITLGGGAVVMEVNTGKILALASYPTFEPHLFNPDTQYNANRMFALLNADQRSPLQNKVLQEQYSPGSVYKIVTTLAAADTDTWQSDQIFNCEIEWRGQERFGDALQVRYDWRILNELESAGEISMVQALTSSCNPFFWEVGALMFQKNPTLQASYAEQLGFGRPTGIDLGGREASGNVARPAVSTQAINNAIGQGDVTVTIIQMAQAVSMIANGGKMYKPYIVDHVGVEGSEGYEQINEPTLINEVEFSPEALQAVRDGMCAVVQDTDLGTAWFVFDSAEYFDQICGKTGTAQTAGAPNAWFVAYYPKDDPEIAIAVLMANSREGSEVSAPIVRRFLDNYLNTFEAPFPDWWRGEYVPLPIQTEDFVNSQGN